MAVDDEICDEDVVAEVLDDGDEEEAEEEVEADDVGEEEVVVDGAAEEAVVDDEDDGTDHNDGKGEFDFVVLLAYKVTAVPLDNMKMIFGLLKLVDQNLFFHHRT